MKKLLGYLQKASTFLYALVMLVKFGVYAAILARAQKRRRERVVLGRKWYLQNARFERQKYWRALLPSLRYLWANQKLTMFLITLIIVALFLPNKQKIGEPPDSSQTEVSQEGSDDDFNTLKLYRIYGVALDLYRYDITNNGAERTAKLSTQELRRRSAWLTLIGSGEIAIDSIAFHDTTGVAHMYESPVLWDTFYRVVTNPFETSRKTPYEAWDEDFEQYGKSSAVVTDTALLDSLIKLNRTIFERVEKEEKEEEKRIAKMRLKEQKRKQELARQEETDYNNPAPRRRPSKQKRIERYIQENWEAAVRTQQSLGIPASITLAQGLLEGNAGDSRLASEYNNHFGVKCAARHGSEGWWSGGCRMYPVRAGHCVRNTDDDHCDKFRIYRSRQESFNSHASLLTQGRYLVLFDKKPVGWADIKKNERGDNADDNEEWFRAAKNWKNPRLRFAYGLDALGYATDPRYADKLLGTIEDYGLARYDEL